MDGEASGRIKCTLANWTGIAYKIPRTELDRCKGSRGFKSRAVCISSLVLRISQGKVLFISGEAGRARKNGEGILNRLQEHKRNREKITGQKPSYLPHPIIHLVPPR